MLDFAERPPKSPEDITLSESGKLLLERVFVNSRVDTYLIAVLGRSAFTEIVDSFAGDVKPMADLNNFNELTRLLVEESESILGEYRAAFSNGMFSMRGELIDHEGIPA